MVETKKIANEVGSHPTIARTQEYSERGVGNPPIRPIRAYVRQVIYGRFWVNGLTASHLDRHRGEIPA